MPSQSDVLRDRSFDRIAQKRYWKPGGVVWQNRRGYDALEINFVG